MGTVAVFGAGGLVGATVARMMALAPEVTRLHLFDINESALRVEAMDAAMTAEKLRPQSLTVHTRTVDMTNVEAVAEAIDQAAPDVLLQAAIPRSWYSFPHRFDPVTWRRLNREARMGPWLPLFMLLPMKLMQGRAQAGSTAPVVQISYPDAVNPALAAAGLAPICGSGNSENICTVMRVVAAEHLGLPVQDVYVRLIANHFHAWALAADDPEFAERPMWYRILVGPDDVTETVTTDAYWADVRQRYPRTRPAFAATSAVKNASRLLRDDLTLSHVTGPGGLIGGVDARLGRSGVELVWPSGISEVEARQLLARAQQGDGIERIADDGAVHFTEGSAQAMRELMNYDCDVLQPDEVEQRAEELMSRIPHD
ncbi:hypothetical protein [Micromonospora sp. CB01531]|uniref:hypothetical protein n=1 Tax=Micromonospora sp. CB01531 TaxID=1718947 RepID=UPI000AB70DAE|nr:hypothetical protein [Micromonospora sp. CB01531]